MSDESEEACLVNPKSPSLTGVPTSGGMPYTDGIQSAGTNSSHHQYNARTNRAGSQQSHESETGELIDYNDEIILSQFHADAIKQAGCGRFQLIAALIAGLGLSGHAIQVYSVFYILPSAEVEFCILGGEKNWLGNITLVGLGVGSLIWGGLAGRSGRRKTLLSCLGVSAVFSVIAAFMPTYGPFMMARFCAAAGIGGALPAASSYLCELTPLSSRARILGLLGACGIAGGILAGGVAILTVPLTGQMVMLENKEHFSAWHRYLLLITFPTLGAILGLFWLPESPRYLLESGREVEALAIYQRMYRTNRSRGGYALTELELPAVRGQRISAPASVLAGMAYSVNMFCGSYLQLFKKRNLRTTMLLLAAWTLAIFVYHGMTIYIAEHSKTIEIDTYDRQTAKKTNITYEDLSFNSSMDNVIYSNCRFVNCTFRRMFLSHVEFNNCTFLETEFANVKTSRTKFQNSLLDDVKLIDTDLTDRHFIDCVSNNTKIIRLLGSCDRDFEYNIFFETLWRSNLGALIPSVIAFGFLGEAVQRIGRNRVAALCFFIAMLLCGLFGFLCEDEQVIWTGGTGQGFMLAGLAALTLLAIETYTTPLRCTALGLFMCGGHIGALIGAPLYGALPLTSTTIAASISTMIMAIPTVAAMALQDPCSLL